MWPTLVVNCRAGLWSWGPRLHEDYNSIMLLSGAHLVCATCLQVLWQDEQHTITSSAYTDLATAAVYRHVFCMFPCS
jgi:hypothetical protein